MRRRRCSRKESRKKFAHHSKLALHAQLPQRWWGHGNKTENVLICTSLIVYLTVLEQCSELEKTYFLEPGPRPTKIFSAPNALTKPTVCSKMDTRAIEQADQASSARLSQTGTLVIITAMLGFHRHFKFTAVCQCSI